MTENARTSRSLPTDFRTHPSTTADAPAIHRLFTAYEENLHGHTSTGTDSVTTALTDPGLEPARDTVLVFDSAGDAAGWGWTRGRRVRRAGRRPARPAGAGDRGDPAAGVVPCLSVARQEGLRPVEALGHGGAVAVRAHRDDGPARFHGLRQVTGHGPSGHEMRTAGAARHSEKVPPSGSCLSGARPWAAPAQRMPAPPALHCRRPLPMAGSVLVKFTAVGQRPEGARGCIDVRLPPRGRRRQATAPRRTSRGALSAPPRTPPDGPATTTSRPHGRPARSRTAHRSR